MWSPIDKQLFEKTMSGNYAGLNTLLEQVVMLLYTIRNNLVHGGKNPNEENDIQVVDMALPILETVVMSFIAR